MAKIRRIVIHCTDTKAGREVSLSEITRWHLSPPPVGHGWKHYGYHILVHLGGTFSFLQPLPKDGILTNEHIANGAKGHNHDSVHVCYVGGRLADNKTHGDTRTKAQRETLSKLIAWLRQQYGQIPVLGHRDLPNVRKACPCFDARKEYNNG